MKVVIEASEYSHVYMFIGYANLHVTVSGLSLNHYFPIPVYKPI